MEERYDLTRISIDQGGDEEDDDEDDNDGGGVLAGRARFRGFLHSVVLVVEDFTKQRFRLPVRKDEFMVMTRRKTAINFDCY